MGNSLIKLKNKIALLIICLLIQSCAEPIRMAELNNNLGFLNTKKTHYVKPSKKPKQPKQKVVTVKRGDQLFILANKYSVSSREIIRLNNLKPPYRLREGQKLTLPKSRLHKVKKGESLYGIARKYNTSITRLVQINSLEEPYIIKSGEKLLIPFSINEFASKKKSYVKTKSKPSKGKKANSKNNYKKNKAHKTSSTAKKNKAKKKNSNNVAKNNKQRSPKYFYWPIKGKIISDYGKKTKGISNDGINIVAKEGTPIRSSAKGTVAYIGRKLKSFGNLVIIRHSGGWLTSYAHQKEVYVTKGTTVKSGQIIGRVGNTGKVKTPQLYFSIRKGKKSINPHKMLKNG